MPRDASSLVFVAHFSEGLRTDVGQDAAPAGSLVKAENVRWIPGGGFYLRKGTKLISAWIPGTGLKIDNSEKSEEFNILFVQSGAKIFHTRGEAQPLYDTGVGLTPGNRCDLKEYNATMKFSNGKDPYGVIAIATFVTPFTNADTTIFLTPGYGNFFTASGRVYCKGQPIDYTRLLLNSSAVTFTADATTDTLTAISHGLQNGNTMTVANSGGALPAGLSANTTYYVINAATDTFKLSTALGGSAIDITDNGSGTQRFSTVNDTLNGCTIPSGSYAVGEIITQSSNPAGAPKGTVMESVFEKIVVGGVSPATHVEYYSKTASAANPAYIDDFTPAQNRELFGKFGRITAMRTLLTKMYVAKDKGIEAWTGIDSNGVPIRSPFTDSYGIVNNACFIQVGDKLIMFTTRNGFKAIQPATIGFDPLPVINPFFDLKIKGTLRQLDTVQAGACMGYNAKDELVRGTVFQTSQRRTIIYDALTENFSVDTGYVPSCWVEWQGNIYFGSATTDKMYRAETEFQDDTSNPALDALTPLHWVGNRRQKVPVSHLYLTGLIKEKTQATITIYTEEGQHRQFTLDGSADYVKKSQVRPLGREFLGIDPMGLTGGDDSAAYEFAVPIDINLDCRFVQIRFQCQGVGYGLQINSYEIVRGESNSASDTQDVIY